MKQLNLLESWADSVIEGSYFKSHRGIGDPMKELGDWPDSVVTEKEQRVDNGDTTQTKKINHTKHEEEKVESQIKRIVRLLKKPN